MHFNVFNSKVTPMYSNYIKGIPGSHMEALQPRLLSAIMRFNSIPDAPFHWEWVSGSYLNNCWVRNLYYELSSTIDPVGRTLSGSFFIPIKTMNIQIKLNSVQQAELKEVMKSDRRVFSQGEIKKLFTDLLHRQYLNGWFRSNYWMMRFKKRVETQTITIPKSEI